MGDILQFIMYLPKLFVLIVQIIIHELFLH